MSLPIAYSSDEEDHISSVKNDLFSLSALPVAKKFRVDEAQLVNPNAAPHVLAEVQIFIQFSSILLKES
jgi:pre-mRNA-processing factor 17